MLLFTIHENNTSQYSFRCDTRCVQCLTIFSRGQHLVGRWWKHQGLCMGDLCRTSCFQAANVWGCVTCAFHIFFSWIVMENLLKLKQYHRLGKLLAVLLWSSHNLRNGIFGVSLTKHWWLWAQMGWCMVIIHLAVASWQFLGIFYEPNARFLGQTWSSLDYQTPNSQILPCDFWQFLKLKMLLKESWFEK